MVGIAECGCATSSTLEAVTRGNFSWDVSGRLSFEWYPGITFVATVKMGHDLASTDVAGSGADGERRSSALNAVLVCGPFAGPEVRSVCSL